MRRKGPCLRVFCFGTALAYGLTLRFVTVLQEPSRCSLTSGLRGQTERILYFCSCVIGQKNDPVCFLGWWEEKKVNMYSEEESLKSDVTA